MNAKAVCNVMISSLHLCVHSVTLPPFQLFSLPGFPVVFFFFSYKIFWRISDGVTYARYTSDKLAYACISLSQILYWPQGGGALLCGWEGNCRSGFPLLVHNTLTYGLSVQ